MSEKHFLDVDIANQVGANAALVYAHLLFWVRRNAKRRKNFREGRFWTYQTTKEIASRFPYMTESQFRRAVEKLEKAGLVATGHFAANRCDRTKWFCILREVDLANLSNANDDPRKSSTDDKPERIKQRSNVSIRDAAMPSDALGDTDRSQGEIGAQRNSGTDLADYWFDRFWRFYPRKVNIKAAREEFLAAVERGVDPERIVRGAENYANRDLLP